MQKRPGKTKKKSMDEQFDIRQLVLRLLGNTEHCVTMWIFTLFPLSSKYLQVTPTYFSLVTASSGPIYWSTEILYVNSAFSRLAFTIPRNVIDDFSTASINDSSRF